MYSTSGSIGSPGITLSPFFEKNALPLSLVNNSAGDLLPGLEVYVNADNAVEKVSTGAQFPIGTVKIGGKPGEMVTIETVFNRDLHAAAKGGTLATGTLVRTDGTVNADNYPSVVVAASGEFCMGVVLAGGAVTTIIRVGILRSPFKV